MAPDELALAKLGHDQIARIVTGTFRTVALFLRNPRWKITTDEADAIAEPAARMLHGRKKLQAVIQKGTDPGLCAFALLAIVESRLLRTAAASAATPARPPAPPPAPAPATPPAPAGPAEEARGTLQDLNPDDLRISPGDAQAILYEMQRGVMQLG